MMRSFAVALPSLILLALQGSVAGQQPDVPARFKNLPKGWTITKTEDVSPKEGSQIVRISNVYLNVDNQTLHVNVVVHKNETNAALARSALLLRKGAMPSRIVQEGSVLYGLVGDAKLVERAYTDLGFKPERITYDVSFTATPIEKCQPMAWNRMYLSFLAKEPNEIQIRELSKGFQFGSQLKLRNHGLGSESSAFVFGTKPSSSKLEADGEITAHAFTNLDAKFGVPQVGVSATITSEAFALTPTRRKAGKELLAATEFWPVDDPEIVAMAKEIVGKHNNPEAKLAAILSWLATPSNFKFDSRIVGSRYGVKTALKQRYGMCWDFSDCFVTLCRASGIPCRQVYGWLYRLEGHVWAEVLIEGKGWRQIEPQAGAGCDTRYIPFVASETGAMPFVYTSAVRIQPRVVKD